VGHPVPLILKLSLGKLHSWEVATWENTLRKLSLGKIPLGKYPWEVVGWEKVFGKVPNIIITSFISSSANFVNIYF